MSTYEALKSDFGTCTPAEKLSILRSEMIPHISAVQGYAMLLSQLDFADKTDMPENIAQWINGLVKASTEIREILDALTG